VLVTRGYVFVSFAASVCFAFRYGVYVLMFLQCILYSAETSYFIVYVTSEASKHIFLFKLLRFKFYCFLFVAVYPGTVTVLSSVWT